MRPRCLSAAALASAVLTAQSIRCVPEPIGGAWDYSCIHLAGGSDDEDKPALYGCPRT